MENSNNIEAPVWPCCQTQAEVGQLGGGFSDSSWRGQVYPSELRVMQERQSGAVFPVRGTDFFKVTLSGIVCLSSSELSEKTEPPIHPRIPVANLKLQGLKEGAVLLPGESHQTPFPRSKLVLKSLDLLGRVGLGSALPALPCPSLCSFSSGRCP